MSAAHTPGPWTVSPRTPGVIIRDYTPISDEGELIASAHGYSNSGYFPSDEEGVANARLIATAPELLEALQALLPMFAQWHEDFPDDVGHKEVPALEAARAAIAKATGAAA